MFNYKIDGEATSDYTVAWLVPALVFCVEHESDIVCVYDKTENIWEIHVSNLSKPTCDALVEITKCELLISCFRLLITEMLDVSYLSDIVTSIQTQTLQRGVDGEEYIGYLISTNVS